MRAAWLVLAIGCGGSPTGGGDVPGDGSGSGSSHGDGGAVTLRDRQRQLAIDLRGTGDFMVGVGNDNNGPYDDGVPIDLHYAYLDGYGDQGGWPTWNTDGDYPLFFAQTDATHGVTPMFTYYQLALELENQQRRGVERPDAHAPVPRRRAPAVPEDRGERHARGGAVRARLLRLPDAARGGGHAARPDPREDRTSPTCPSARRCPRPSPGLMHCIVAIGRAVAPAARIGFHASMWGAYYDGLDPNADIEASGKRGRRLPELGRRRRHRLRHGRDARSRRRVLGDERRRLDAARSRAARAARCTGTRRTSALPNFSQHLRWVTALTAELAAARARVADAARRAVADVRRQRQHWRDNRVHYFFGHVADLVDAGIAGMTFGTGAGGQTDLATDGDQLKTAENAYLAAPTGM